MKAFTYLSLASVATAAAVQQVNKPVKFEDPVGKAPEVPADEKATEINSNVNPAPDTGKTYFTYRGWTGNLCDGNQNIDYEYTFFAFPQDLRVAGTHSVSFDNYGDCRDIQCTYTEDGGNRRATYHYHQGYCYNINTGWAILNAECVCLYCNGNNCHT